LKLKYDQLLSSVSDKFRLRPYEVARAAAKKSMAEAKARKAGAYTRPVFQLNVSTFRMTLGGVSLSVI
jgi:hypothetical protein